MIGKCDICRYGQGDLCTNPDRDITEDCFVSHTGETIAEKMIRADAIDEYKDRLLELCDCGIERADCTGGNCLKCMDNVVDYSSIIDLAEELKTEAGGKE